MRVVRVRCMGAPRSSIARSLPRWSRELAALIERNGLGPAAAEFIEAHPDDEGRSPSILPNRVPEEHAARDTSRIGSEVIFIELLDEGVEVYAPVEAESAPDGSYVLPPSAPEDQTWAFAPGARVTCERRGADLYAASLAAEQ